MINKLPSQTPHTKLVKELLASYGNAFYISSTHVSVSYVWSYSDKVTIYKVVKGKVVDTKEQPIMIAPNWLNQPSKAELYELDTCMELDGDMFGFMLKKDDKVEQSDLPISLDCFKGKKFKSDFLNGVVADLNKYQIGW